MRVREVTHLLRLHHLCSLHLRHTCLGQCTTGAVTAAPAHTTTCVCVRARERESHRVTARERERERESTAAHSTARTHNLVILLLLHPHSVWQRLLMVL